jgi:CRISPR-associated protein Cas4
MYHRTPQTVGKMKHETIDSGTYSTQKRYLQSLEIYSDTYGIAGKLDIYDAEEKTIIERKTRIKTVYDGYRYQLYAQYFCMIEMGYTVEKLFWHSLADNKRIPLPLPGDAEKAEFEAILQKIKTLHATDAPILENSAKCAQCIYKPLCH